jgi:hypothetical protein
MREKGREGGCGRSKGHDLGRTSRAEAMLSSEPRSSSAKRGSASKENSTRASGRPVYRRVRVSEDNGKISRESITVLSRETLQAGAVLGKVTASGKLTRLRSRLRVRAPKRVDGCAVQ